MAFWIYIIAGMSGIGCAFLFAHMRDRRMEAERGERAMTTTREYFAQKAKDEAIDYVINEDGTAYRSLRTRFATEKW